MGGRADAMSETDRRSAAGAGGLPAAAASSASAGWLLEIVPYGIFTTDREFRITNWNRWMVSHSGRPASEVVGRVLTELYPDLLERRLERRYASALEGEVSILSAALHRHLLPLPATVPESGLPHMLQTAQIAPLPEESRIVGTITIIEDVTQREFHAGILRRQQGLDRMLSDALGTLLQATDPQQEMEEIFATVRLSLGLDAYASYLLGPDGKTLELRHSMGIAPKLRESISVLPAFEFVSLPDSVVPENLAGGRQFGALQNVGLAGLWCLPLSVGERGLGLVAFGSYERTQIPLPDLQALNRIARYVAVAIDRARRGAETIAASRAKDDFLAALSHELRTPLNPVLLVASDAADNLEFPDEARQAFRVIERNARLEARLIDDLLDLTRVAHGKLALDLQPLDAHASLRDAIVTVRSEIVERSLSLRQELQDQGQLVLGDNARLQQVFWNVLKNAVKFSHRGGHISIASHDAPGGDEIVFTVTDNGVGMDEPELTRVFEAFAQGDHAGEAGSHRFGGLGLGLAISRKLIELHGGSIAAASPGKGKGSVFTIRMPLLSQSGRSLLLASPRRGQGREVAAGRSGARRILLVEDHDETADALTRLLKRRHYDVVTTGSQAAALEAARGGQFHAVVSDIGLPDGDGFVLMRELRDTYGLPGIALTGYGMEEDHQRGREAGFITHLTKPISIEMLERALEQVWQRG